MVLMECDVQQKHESRLWVNLVVNERKSSGVSRREIELMTRGRVKQAQQAHLREMSRREMESTICNKIQA